MIPPDVSPPSDESKPVDEPTPDFRLRIDAHALVQLGEQLITDDEQALLELAKNSYDADGDYAKIRIETEYVPTSEDLAPPEALGLIEIEDNGSGMDEEGLRNGWLLISLSLKRDQKLQREPTKKYNRYPLGDKGLGRLGTMKLGKCLSVETRSSETKEGWLVTFQWSDIRSGTPLENVPITWKRIPANGKTGTIVRIFGLRDRLSWKLKKRRERVQTRLSGLLSPFKVINDFEVTLMIDSANIGLAQITKKLRDTATVTVGYDWNGDRLKIDAKIKLIWFRKKRVDAYNTYILTDGGVALFEALRNLRGADREFHLQRITDGPWFLAASTEIAATDIFAKDPDATNPGPFSGSLDYFDLDNDIELPQDFLSGAKEYKDLVKGLAQLYVYRDGFGIRMPNDWLGLGGAWTSQAGFYSLKPSNVIGYFQISVEHNAGLVEKSDREGFTETPDWRGFKLAAQQVIDGFSNKLLNRIGKASADFLKRMTGEHPGDEEQETRYSQMLARLESLLASASDFKQQLETNAGARRSALRRVEGAARVLFLDRKLPQDIRGKATGLLGAIEETQKELVHDHELVLAFATRIVEQKGLAAIVRKRIEDFEERLQILYDMVAMGLSAQALAHDVPALLHNANDHANALLKLSRSRDLSAEAVASKAVRITEAIEGLRQMVEFVQPMLRGKRFTKRRAPVSEFVRDFFQQRGARLMTRCVKWYVETEGQQDFSILYNPGRFIQIIDNLTTNSEYWIEYLYGKGSNNGAITVQIVDPNLVFFDNGPGVRPDLEESMFEMFTTGKPKDEGTGLGLFITQQLLLRDGCSIMLANDTNDNGRRYKFVINFSGAKSTST